MFFNSKLQIDPMMNKKLSFLGALILGLLSWAGVAFGQAECESFSTADQTVRYSRLVSFYNYYDNGGQFGNYGTNYGNFAAITR